MRMATNQPRITGLLKELEILCDKWSLKCLQTQTGGQMGVHFHYQILPEQGDTFSIKLRINSVTHRNEIKHISHLKKDRATINLVALWLKKFLSNSFHGVGVKVLPPENCGY